MHHPLDLLSTALRPTSSIVAALTLVASGACEPLDESSQCTTFNPCAPDGINVTSTTGADPELPPSMAPESCAEAELVSTNAGCRFWAVDLPTSWEPSEPYGSVAADQQFAVVVTNVSPSERAEVAVYLQREDSPLQTTTLEPGEVFTFKLPAQNVDCTQNGPSKAYRIESDRPIAAYQFQPLDNNGALYTADASALFPEHVLGEDYLAVTGHGNWLRMYPDGFDPVVYNAGAFITIVGTEDQTHVKVYPKIGILAPTVSGLTINRGDAFTIFSDIDQATTADHGDLSGTRVLANKPIALFGGSVSTNMPVDFDGCCADHLEHQNLPLAAWGSSYVVAPPPSIFGTEVPAPAVYRLTGAFDDTALEWPVGVPPGAPHVIDSGQTKIFETDRPVVVRTTDPSKTIALTQFLVSSEAGDPNGSGLGDPAMTVLPAVEQMQPAYSFLIPQGYGSNYATIVAPASAEVYLDSVRVELERTVGRLDGVEFLHGSFEVEAGTHEVRSTEGINLSVVGYDEWVSYAFPGGCGIEAVSDLPPVP